MEILRSVVVTGQTWAKVAAVVNAMMLESAANITILQFSSLFLSFSFFFFFFVPMLSSSAQQLPVPTQVGWRPRRVISNEKPGKTKNAHFRSIEFFPLVLLPFPNVSAQSG